MRLLLAAMLLGSLAGGCATVQPWQKERLSQAHMQFTQSLRGQYFLDHSVITVEQAEGGNGKAGGGCGCR
jgi:hypothetical protein